MYVSSQSKAAATFSAFLPTNLEFRLDTTMYFSHFGLAQAPFSITPNPSFFYSGCSRGDILQALLYAVSHGEGIIKVTGEVGSGKTMLCRMLEANMPANVEVIFLANPTLARDQVAYALAGELKLDIAGKRADEVTRLLQQDLIGKHIQGKQVVLLVEEAQAMSLETLEEIRLFSNLETAHHKLLQIILFGQPELDLSLALPRMRQLKERITHSFQVPPIPAQHIGDFLMFRMRQAGYSGENIFSAAAIKQLAWVSKGIVRRINILADKAMLAAFAENAKQVGKKQMNAAIKDSEFGHYRGKLAIELSWKIALGAAIVACIFLAFYLGRQSSTTASAPSTTTAANMASNATASTSASTSSITPPVALANNAEKSIPALPSAPAPAPAASVAVVNPPTPETAIATAKHVAPPAVSSAPSALEPTEKVDQQLAQRLLASRGWLLETNADRHTLQLNLVAANKHAELGRFLNKLRADLGTEQIFVYPSRIGGLPRYGVLYGSFASRAEAKEKMQQLQKEFGHPSQIRTVGGLREEMRKFQSEDLWLAK